MKTPILITLLAAGMISAASAAVVFTDDFEIAISNAATYTVGNTSQKVDTAKWVRSTAGYKASQNGIVNENRVGESISIDGGSQAWAGRYSSNSGVTTAFDTIGTLAPGQTITVSFDAAIDGTNGGSDINAYIVLFDGAGTRDATQSDLNNTFAALAHNTETATAGWATYQMSYTVGDDGLTAYDVSWLGKDIAVRFKHTNDALIDNVSVDIIGAPIPEPSAALLGGLGFLLLLRRRRA